MKIAIILIGLLVYLTWGENELLFGNGCTRLLQPTFLKKEEKIILEKIDIYNHVIDLLTHYQEMTWLQHRKYENNVICSTVQNCFRFGQLFEFTDLANSNFTKYKMVLNFFRIADDKTGFCVIENSIQSLTHCRNFLGNFSTSTPLTQPPPSRSSRRGM